MAQLLHHQESAFYDKELHGCRWGILQFFGFRRHLRSTKMLSDKKHGQGKSNNRNRRRSSYAPLKDEDSGVLDDERNTESTKKQKASKRNSGKASLRSLILRKLYGKQGQKEKMLPVAPKLLRTISIHYLETNEYVLGSEASSSGHDSSRSTTLSMQNATDTNLQHVAANTTNGRDSDTGSLLLLNRGDSNVRRKSHRSISMDGVLHKVPYGKKVPPDVICEELPRSTSATYDRDGLKSYIGVAAKRHVNQGFRRSRSLTESLESYSRLLDSIAGSEKKLLTSLNSMKDSSLDGPSVMSSSQVRNSNAEFRSQGPLVRHDENFVTPEDTLASHVPKETDVGGDVTVTVDESVSDEITGGSENISLFEGQISEKTCDVAVSTVVDSCTAPSPSIVDISEEQAATCDDNDQASSSTEVDMCDVSSTPEEVDTLEECSAPFDGCKIQSSSPADSCTNFVKEHTCHDNQMQSFQDSKPIEGTFVVPCPSHEFEADISLSCEQETESPMSVLDIAFSDDPASPVKHKRLDDTLLKPTILNLNGTDVLVDIEQESYFDELNGLEVDPTHEVEFNYVKDIFQKSSFRNEILFDEWYSQNVTALQEEDCQHYEVAAAAFDFTDMSVDQLLLFDLTNEALLDIYKKYSVSKSKVSWFSSFDRPKPVGHLVLKELWSRVSCRLDKQPWSSIEVDMILSNDLAKSDHWINFQRDADHLGNKLADSVLDKLLAELILQLAEF